GHWTIRAIPLRTLCYHGSASGAMENDRDGSRGAERPSDSAHGGRGAFLQRGAGRGLRGEPSDHAVGRRGWSDCRIGLPAGSEIEPDRWTRGWIYARGGGAGARSWRRHG